MKVRSYRMLSLSFRTIRTDVIASKREMFHVTRLTCLSYRIICIFIVNMNKFYIYVLLYLDIREVYRNNRRIHLYDVVVFSRNHYLAIHQSIRYNVLSITKQIPKKTIYEPQLLAEVVCIPSHLDSQLVENDRHSRLLSTNVLAESEISVRVASMLR